MKTSILQIVFFFLISFNCIAQSDFGSSNILSDVLGDQNYYAPNSFAALENPAALANIKNFSFGVSAKNNWFVSDLNSFYFSTALPTNSGNFGLGISHTGIEGFTQSKVGIAYGRSIL